MDTTGEEPEDPGEVGSTQEWRRSYPRVGMRCVAWIKTANGQVHRTQVLDMSMSGIQIRVAPKTACAVHPRGKFMTRENAPLLLLKLSLPISDDDPVAVVKCQVTYFKFQPNGTVVFGLGFRDLGGISLERMTRYFELSMMPQA